MRRSVNVRLDFSDACALRALALQKIGEMERSLRVCGDAATPAERQMFDDFLVQLRNSLDRIEAALNK